MQQSKAARPTLWTAPSHLTVFVRNLTLLQLDQHDDWPHITLHTLSPSPQNQRQRVHAIEWALYHLFSIWDPESTRNKLRPFFPPIEPLQSVNLRAALFRALSEVKKNGELGRETIVRKTMLDDCKGEKFEELLAAFSTVVLRKVSSTISNSTMTAAGRLSIAKQIKLDEYSMLLPLVLAHQVSLNSMKRRQAEGRNTYDKFELMLDQKHAELTAMSKETVSCAPDGPIDAASLSRELRASWLGGEAWARTLIEGGLRSSVNGLSELSFSEAWSRAKDPADQVFSSETTQDLLIDLESRITVQRDRLRKWHQFSQSIQKNRGSGVSQAQTRTQSNLVFKDHRALQVASVSKAVRSPVNGSALHEADQSLIDTLREAIASINGNGKPRSASASRQPKPHIHDAERATLFETESGKFLSMSETRIRDAVLETAEVIRDYQANASSSQINRPKPLTADSLMEIPYDDPAISSSAAELSSNIDHFNPSTLIERTRKSMSLIPPTDSGRRRKESIRPRKPRPSFPVNQFETPQKQPSHSRHPTSRTFTSVELLEEDADYASVFKSRPRVLNSPVASPAVHVAPLDEFDLEAESVAGPGSRAVYGDEDSSDLGMVDSPLTNARICV